MKIYLADNKSISMTSETERKNMALFIIIIYLPIIIWFKNKKCCHQEKNNKKKKEKVRKKKKSRYPTANAYFWIRIQKNKYYYGLKKEKVLHEHNVVDMKASNPTR